MPPEVEFAAGDGDAGARLDALVAGRARISRALAARLIAAGAVTVDGVALGKSARVEAGATVHVRLPDDPAAPAAEELPVPLEFSDEHLMVVNKPAGVVVHPAAGHAGGTLVNALIAHGAAGGDPQRPGIVHRLDAGTSGLMIVAKSEAAHTLLVAALAAREVHREYLALTEGVPATDTLTIDAPVGRSPRHRKKMAVVAGGKPALTAVEVLERHARTALARARPHTGRTHQIRVHLAAAGHPVVGDPVYGRDRALARTLGLARPFLHAAGLAFTHPVTGQALVFAAAVPLELVAALERARGL
jgi:23S rRNA pseudouridine1911/1915/1917 synthase